MSVESQLSSPHPEAVTPGTSVLGHLVGVAQRTAPVKVADRLAQIHAFLGGELADLTTDLIEAAAGPRAVQQAAAHLLSAGGKHIRPICVALAAACGKGLGPHGHDVAIAVELVHSATLLHDDVVDLGETRRGEPTSRAIYGNATSIFAGDWLLIDALRRVRRADDNQLVDRLLEVIDEMILAESLQLERRGCIDGNIAEYLQVAEGKTAALFRFALFSGARLGGLPANVCADLERYGLHLGVAFQAIDDYLDIAGDATQTGKTLFTDLREGKLTYPILVGLERDPSLRPLLLEVSADDPEQGPADPKAVSEILRILEETGALAACRGLAEDRAASAIDCLRSIPVSGHAARFALENVARALVYRHE